jgi:hypothetical protein
MDQDSCSHVFLGESYSVGTSAGLDALGVGCTVDRTRILVNVLSHRASAAVSDSEDGIARPSPLPVSILNIKLEALDRQLLALQED